MVVEEVQSVLEMYSGLALAADQMNSKDVYDVCSTRFGDFVKLLDLYRNVEEVETMILQVFNHLVHCQVGLKVTQTSENLVITVPCSHLMS